MTMIYEITGNPDGTVSVDCREHGSEEEAKACFYRKTVDYLIGYLAGAGEAEDAEGDLYEPDNRNELRASLAAFIKSNPVAEVAG